MITEEDKQFIDQATLLNPEDLEAEFTFISSHFAYVVSRYVAAVEDNQRAEIELNRARGRARQVAKAVALSNSEKITEASLLADIDADSEVIEFQLRFIETDSTQLRWKLTLEALRLKKDALVSIGAQRRSEVAAGVL